MFGSSWMSQLNCSVSESDTNKTIDSKIIELSPEDELDRQIMDDILEEEDELMKNDLPQIIPEKNSENKYSMNKVGGVYHSVNAACTDLFLASYNKIGETKNKHTVFDDEINFIQRMNGGSKLDGELSAKKYDLTFQMNGYNERSSDNIYITLPNGNYKYILTEVYEHGSLEGDIVCHTKFKVYSPYGRNDLSHVLSLDKMENNGQLQFDMELNEKLENTQIEIKEKLSVNLIDIKKSAIGDERKRKYFVFSIGGSDCYDCSEQYKNEVDIRGRKLREKYNAWTNNGKYDLQCMDDTDIYYEFVLSTKYGMKWFLQSVYVKTTTYIVRKAGPSAVDNSLLSAIEYKPSERGYKVSMCPYCKKAKSSESKVKNKNKSFHMKEMKDELHKHSGNCYDDKMNNNNNKDNEVFMEDLDGEDDSIPKTSEVIFGSRIKEINLDLAGNVLSSMEENDVLKPSMQAVLDSPNYWDNLKLMRDLVTISLEKRANQDFKSFFQALIQPALKKRRYEFVDFTIGDRSLRIMKMKILGFGINNRVLFERVKGGDDDKPRSIVFTITPQRANLTLIPKYLRFRFMTTQQEFEDENQFAAKIDNERAVIIQKNDEGVLEWLYLFTTKRLTSGQQRDVWAQATTQ